MIFLSHIIKMNSAYPVDQSDKIQTYELEEALRKQQQFLRSDQILSEETVFLVPKRKISINKRIN